MPFKPLRCRRFQRRGRLVAPLVASVILGAVATAGSATNGVAESHPDDAPQKSSPGESIGIALPPARIDALEEDSRLVAGRAWRFGDPAAGFGYAICDVGDWNADGVADLAASAPALGEDLPGSVWVLSGSNGHDLARFVGAAGEDFGYALAGGIDVDGDRVGDLLIGVRGAAGGGVRRGEVRCYSGRTKQLVGRPLLGPEDHALFGSALAIAGDLDEDGVREVLVGAPGASDNAGAVRVYSGRSLRLLHTVRGKRPGARLGTAVADAGDHDGDGRSDLLIGSPGEYVAAADTGAVRVVSGRSYRTLRTLWGTAAHERFGTRVASLGDVTGDGRAEIAVASPTAELNSLTDVGHVRVFEAAEGKLHFQVRGEVAGAFFGRGLAGGPDVDGDGWPDLLVGVPYAVKRIGRNDRRVGAVQVFSGVDGRQLQTFLGEDRGGLLGWSVAVLADPRDSGVRVAVVAGAPGRRDTPPQAGDSPPQQGRVQQFQLRAE